jgi:hypothetical protein
MSKEWITVVVAIVACGSNPTTIGQPKVGQSTHVMTNDVTERIKLGFECLPDNKTRADYLRFLAEHHLEGPNEVGKVSRCFEKEIDLETCLERTVGLRKSRMDYGILPIAKIICRNYAEAAAKTYKTNGHSYHFAEAIRLDNVKSYNYYKLTPLEIDVLDEIASFYYSQFPSWVKDVQSYLQKRREFADRLRLYPTRMETRSLVPVACSNYTEWVRNELEIDGLPYTIPVFHPQKDGIPWWLYQDILRVQFEVLKSFLSPIDLQRILSPGKGVSDLGLYISGPNARKNKEFYRACGIDLKTSSGHYDPNSNLVSIHRGDWYLLENGYVERVPLFVIGAQDQEGLSREFYHEMGHVIYHLLLDDRARIEIAALYYLTRSESAHDPKNSAFVPLAHHDPDGKPYSLQDPSEFFAEWISEYFETQVTGIESNSLAFRARKQILHEFFAPKGINPRAFDRDPMQAAFRATGISMVRNRLSPMVIGGFQSLTVPFEGERQKFLGPVLGVKLGYLYQQTPTGWILGAGGGFSHYYTELNFDNNRNGVQDQYLLRTSDVDIWAFVARGFSVFDLVLLPEIGFRTARLEHFQVDAQNAIMLISRNSANSFWLGGQIGYIDRRVPVGIWTGARFLLEGGFSVGINVSLDLVQIYLRLVDGPS